MGERLRVIILGGSPTAAQLVADFVSRQFVEVVGVADVDPSSQGARVAERFDIPFTTDIRDFGSLTLPPDVIIDVCGRPHVIPAIVETFAAPEDGGPVVVHDMIARLILTLAADSSSLHPGCGVFARTA